MLLLFVQATTALHFYLETGEARCFFEELPKDTLVVAKVKALEYDSNSKDFVANRNLKLEFTVDVCIITIASDLTSDLARFNRMSIISTECPQE